MVNPFTSADEAFKALIPFATDDSNPLWDSGLLFISKGTDDNYFVELTGFYYQSDSDKIFQNPFEKEREISFDSIHKMVYDYLQMSFANTNPKVKWDRLILEVRADGSYTPHYEFGAEEVSPDAAPEPETITASYICENLRNCLAQKAPSNYQWLWEVLERKKTEDDRIEIGGKFYYSLNEDKSDPQKLEPAEYIYMYNVSERLFDQFLIEKTKGWSQIQLEFSKSGMVNYQVKRRGF